MSSEAGLHKSNTYFGTFQKLLLYNFCVSLRLVYNVQLLYRFVFFRCIIGPLFVISLGYCFDVFLLCYNRAVRTLKLIVLCVFLLLLYIISSVYVCNVCSFLLAVPVSVILLKHYCSFCFKAPLCYSTASICWFGGC